MIIIFCSLKILSTSNLFGPLCTSMFKYSCMLSCNNTYQMHKNADTIIGALHPLRHVLAIKTKPYYSMDKFEQHGTAVFFIIPHISVYAASRTSTWRNSIIYFIVRVLNIHVAIEIYCPGGPVGSQTKLNLSVNVMFYSEVLGRFI